MKTSLSENLYEDSLIKVTPTEILYKNYGIFGSSKKISITDLKKIRYAKPTLLNGKYRFHGTGDFKTWFPSDYARSKRDLIFIAEIRNKWQNIGFTVEDSNRFIEILQKLNLISESEIAPSKEGKDYSKTASRNKWIMRTITIAGTLMPVLLLVYFLLA